jgi:hypothetical protein
MNERGAVENPVFATTPLKYSAALVPAGRDGRAWRFRGEHVGDLELVSVPPFLAWSPDEMLVPAELVTQPQKRLR